MLEFITNRDIYDKVVCERIPKAKHYVWLATADLKDMYVDKKRSMVPFLEVLSDLVAKNVEIRLLHAKEPGERFRRDFDKYPNLISGVERILCPRVHFKSVVVDGEFAYSGSANITGAGMGAKNKDRRNFEAGIITTDKDFIEKIMNQIDGIWMGDFCRSCQRKDYCSDYQDIILARG